jgi:transcriptional regulator with XRE-family HTH domain
LFAGQGQLSKVERGKVAPTLEILLGLATKFGKSLDWIAGSDESEIGITEQGARSNGGM